MSDTNAGQAGNGMPVSKVVPVQATIKGVRKNARFLPCHDDAGITFARRPRADCRRFDTKLSSAVYCDRPSPSAGGWAAISASTIPNRAKFAHRGFVPALAELCGADRRQIVPREGRYAGRLGIRAGNNDLNQFGLLQGIELGRMPAPDLQARQGHARCSATPSRARIADTCLPTAPPSGSSHQGRRRWQERAGRHACPTPPAAACEAQAGGRSHRIVSANIPPPNESITDAITIPTSAESHRSDTS